MKVSKFYICKHCGNIVQVVVSSGIPVMCCGEAMSELIPNTVEASKEKHIPVVSVKANQVHVNVGSEPHPMTPEHYIMFVSMETKQGTQRKYLKPGDVPQVDFALAEGDLPTAVYAYCNIHGLWVSTI